MARGVLAVTSPPSSAVLHEFGAARSVLTPLAGGQGEAWRADDLVLKPAPSAVEADWVASVLADLPQLGFRISRPVCAASGAWVVDGWVAWTLLDGVHDFTRWAEVIRSGVAFHSALEGVARPSFLDLRATPWAVGDRTAWGEAPLDVIHGEFAPILDTFVAMRRPNALPSQLIHGDLSGNVLFADPAPPGVIDFSPYWRPAAFALAVVVVDAIAWHGADSSITDTLPGGVDWGSMIARAAIYRLVTSDRAADVLLPTQPAYVERTITAHEPLVHIARRTALIDG